MLHTAVSATFDALSFDAPAWCTWADGFEPDPGDLALIEESHTAATFPLDVVLLRELPWQDRLAYVWGVATPSRATLESRGETHWGRLRRGVSRIRAAR